MAMHQVLLDGEQEMVSERKVRSVPEGFKIWMNANKQQYKVAKGKRELAIFCGE